MPKVYCPCVECKYHGRVNNCKAEKLILKWRNMATVNEGRVDMWICDQYEEKFEAQEIIAKFPMAWWNAPYKEEQE